jgi:flavin-binding protein dodecin
VGVAKVEEISATSSVGFEDAIKAGLARATKTLRGVRSAWVKEQHVRLGGDGQIAEYQVNLKITFVLED